MKCIACGSTSLVEGSLTYSDTESIKFTLSGESILRRIIGKGSRSVHAYGCTHCRHMQLAVDFSDEDLERYQSFEGEQPSVVDRMRDE